MARSASRTFYFQARLACAIRPRMLVNSAALAGRLDQRADQFGYLAAAAALPLAWLLREPA
jgi:hypothetical protein